jgi:alpha-glucosidase
MKKLLLFFLFVPLLLSTKDYKSKEFDLKSPDGQLHLQITIGDKISYKLKHFENNLISSPEVSMKLRGNEILGLNTEISKSQKRSHNEVLPAFLHRNPVVKDEYNEINLTFKGDYGLIFRVYNDGMAYRFTTNRKRDLIVEDETAVFNFDKNYMTWVAYSNGKEENRFKTSFQAQYNYEEITKFDQSNIGMLPLLVDLENNIKLCLIEADLEDYPGMFVSNNGKDYAYKGVFAKYPKAEIRTETRLQQIVSETENFIAKTKGGRVFPWRGYQY